MLPRPDTEPDAPDLIAAPPTGEDGKSDRGQSEHQKNRERSQAGSEHRTGEHDPQGLRGDRHAAGNRYRHHAENDDERGEHRHSCSFATEVIALLGHDLTPS